MSRYLCDAMLGKLVTSLRMRGLDTAYALDRDIEADDELLEWARSEDRTLVTRNRGLADRAEDAIFVAARESRAQVRELCEAGVELSLPDDPTRCSQCNGRLVEAGDEPRPDYAPPPTERPAWRCVECGQYYWRGSHWADVAERFDTC